MWIFFRRINENRSLQPAWYQAREAGYEERSLSLEPPLVFGEQSAGGHQGAAEDGGETTFLGLGDCRFFGPWSLQRMNLFKNDMYGLCGYVLYVSTVSTDFDILSRKNDDAGALVEAHLPHIVLCHQVLLKALSLSSLWINTIWQID